MTNADKFFYTFGFEPLKDCIIPDTMCPTQQEGLNRHNPWADCQYCPYLEWWDKEYEAVDKLPFE